MYPGIISFLFFALDPLIICQTILSVKKGAFIIINKTSERQICCYCSTLMPVSSKVCCISIGQCYISIPNSRYCPLLASGED